MSEHETLAALYPFLQQDGAVRRSDEEMLASVGRKARDSQETVQEFFRISGARVVAVARTIAAVYERQGKLLTMGNGGSSCDAAHIAVEFLHPVTTGRPSLPAINLCADHAMMTAVGNDVGFEHVFVRQVIAHARPQDALFGVSTSGNSANLLRAFDKAKELGVATIALTGGSGGRLAESSAVDHCLIVRTESIHRVQECHVLIYHILWDIVHTLLADFRTALDVQRNDP